MERHTQLFFACPHCQMFEPHDSSVLQSPSRLVIGIFSGRLEARWASGGCQAAAVAHGAQETLVVAGAATPVAHLLAEGVAVVLVDPDAEALGRVAHHAHPPARLAILVGDPSEPAVWAAAELMAEELFGGA
jgi:hypothetical protein